MANKIEKVLKQEQMEGIVLFAYNMLKDGYSMNFIRERTIDIESDEHICRIITTLFDDNKKIIQIVVKNKSSKKEINLDMNGFNDRTNISKQLFYLQKEVDHIIELNKPVYYTDDEVKDVIGDPSLLGMRSVKVEHLIDNIGEKKESKKKKWFRR